VRLTYIDEAGISKKEPFAVVGGIIVHADQKLNAIENQLERIMHRHIPAEHHENFVFSAKHLFNGDNKVFRRDDAEWPIERRLKIADEIVAIPEKFNLPVALSWVERAEFPRSFDLPKDMSEKDKAIGLHVCAFLSCAMMVEHWMRRNASHEVCMLVVENNDQAKKND
jgi:hypothetical protein